jgi:hypothetical protein
MFAFQIKHRLDKAQSGIADHLCPDKINGQKLYAPNATVFKKATY